MNSWLLGRGTQGRQPGCPKFASVLEVLPQNHVGTEKLEKGNFKIEFKGTSSLPSPSGRPLALLVVILVSE